MVLLYFSLLIGEKKVTMEGKKVTMEGKKVSMEGKKVSMEGKKVSMEGNFLPKSGNGISVFLKKWFFCHILFNKILY